MSTLQGSWIWYELMTPAPDASRTFYEKAVGWSMKTDPDDGYGFITNGDGGMTGGVLTLTAEMQAHGARPCWLGYIGVDDCDAMAKAIIGKGGKILMPARDIPMAGRIAMVADPGGAVFYIMTPKPPPGAPQQQSTAFSASALGRCAWNELLAADQKTALDFYTSLFGWSLPEPMDMGAMGTYQFIAHDGERVGAVMQKPPQAPVPRWHHYFRVAAIGRAKDAITAHGGHVLLEPMEVPGGDFIIQAVDPQGAFFALVGQK